MEHGRLLFKRDKKTITALNLDGKREKFYGKWLIQATVFYTNLLTNDEIVKKFATFSITKEQILDGQKMLASLNQAHAKREENIGEAEEATLLRDAVREDLIEFMDDLIDAAVLALKNTPQQLEKLGIVAKR